MLFHYHYSAEHVVWLLGVTNKALPEHERRHSNLKSEVDSLEAKKQDLLKLIQSYNGQVTALGKSFDNFFLRCEQEEKKLADLRTKRMKEEALARFFRNNDAEYLKIRKTVEEKAFSMLSGRKKILKSAALSLIESIRENPQKYNFLIPQVLPSAIDYTSPNFNPYCVYWPQQDIHSKVYFTEDVVDMLSEDADKLLEKLVKELGDEVISDLPVGTSPKPSLSLLPSSDLDKLKSHV